MKHPFAITLDPDTGRDNLTGAWRTKRPIYGSYLPPCNHACPAGENIQQWLYWAEEGNYEKAWRTLMEDNPLPAIHGRICYHPCEDTCNRGKVDQVVSIHAVERFLGDQAIKQGWIVECAPDSRKRVLVVGSGPSGLSAAYHLRRLGHAVTVREAMPKLGGMLRYGIPAYRLPRDVLDGEIRRLATMGIRFECDAKVTEIRSLLESKTFDAVFLAIGAHKSKHVNIPSREAGKIMDALSLLRTASNAPEEAKVKLGRRVAIYGGGNTAMDAARTALRLGAEETVIIYRRDEAHMPAHKSELEEAMEEGVRVQWLSTIKEMNDDLIEIELMELDAKGFPQPTGKFERVKADTLVLALGQDSESDFLRGLPGVKVAKDGVVDVDATMMTGFKGLFAGGDMVPSNRTAAIAVGHGKKAARNIDAFLRGTTHQAKTKTPLAIYERMNTWYYSDAPKSVQPTLDNLRRLATFDETVGGLTEETALYEARRCLSCGNCIACDNCYGVCPDNAVRKLGIGTFSIDLDYCKGCGICVEECPTGCMEMIREPD
jgi:NADPH-dependent glutamate synthase beta subunit-like oxidoreductase